MLPKKSLQANNVMSQFSALVIYQQNSVNGHKFLLNAALS
jgi:hypothetical protein